MFLQKVCLDDSSVWYSTSNCFGFVEIEPSPFSLAEVPWLSHQVYVHRLFPQMEVDADSVTEIKIQLPFDCLYIFSERRKPKTILFIDVKLICMLMEDLQTTLFKTLYPLPSGISAEQVEMVRLAVEQSKLYANSKAIKRFFDRTVEVVGASGV